MNMRQTTTNKVNLQDQIDKTVIRKLYDVGAIAMPFMRQSTKKQVKTGIRTHKGKSSEFLTALELVTTLHVDACADVQVCNLNTFRVAIHNLSKVYTKKFTILHIEGEMYRVFRKKYDKYKKALKFDHIHMPKQDYAKAKYCVNNLPYKKAQFITVENIDTFTKYLEQLTPKHTFIKIEQASYNDKNKIRIERIV